MISEMKITVTAAELLGGIWYGDGSGARHAVQTTTTPDEWTIYFCVINDDGTIELSLRRKGVSE